MGRHAIHILATIILTLCTAEVTAQVSNSTLKWPESTEFLPIDFDGAWHIVQGTQVTIILNSTHPANTDSKKYEEEVTYRQGNRVLSANTDTFEPTSGEVTYTAIFKYKNYTYDAETESWTTDDVTHEETASAGKYLFKVYGVPTVSDVIITTSSPSTYHGGKTINAKAGYTTSPQELQHAISWYINGQEVKSGTDTYDFTPETVGKAEIEARVSVIAPNGSTVWASKEGKNSITVYEKPEISDFKVSSDLPYTYVGGSNRKITADYKTSPEALPIKIEWLSNDKKVQDGENTYTFNPTEAGDVAIQAKVSIMDPDGKDTWATATQSTNIKVYEKPEISNFKVTSDGLYAFVGENDKDITANYKTSPESLPTKIEWSVNGVTMAESNSTYHFVPDMTGDVKITAKVSILAPDGITEWETANEQTTIQVLSAPQYAEVDMHQQPSDSHEYAIHTGESFDIAALYTHTGGYPEGWTYNIAINGIETSNSQFTPSTSGDYEISLVVENKAPGAATTWLWEVSDYILHVYDVPTWSTNLDKIFDDDSHTLNVQSGDDIAFEISTKHGNPSGWSVEIEEQQGQTVALQNENGVFRHTLSCTNDSEVESTKSITLKIANSIEFQARNSKTYAENINCQVNVWKDITASITLPKPNTEGKSIMDTREGDEQKLAVSLVGGDAKKWHVTTTCTENANGTSAQDGYTYTYTLAPGALTSNGAESKNYTYHVTAIYHDGQTHIERTLPVDVQVWPAPQVLEGLALGNKTGVKYKGKHIGMNHVAYEDITYYNADSFLLSFAKSGGVPGGDWKYQADNGEKQNLPADGCIQAEGIKSITFYNYIGSEAERQVLTVNITAATLPAPEIATNRFPTVDLTTATDWENAEIKDGKNAIPVDLYGDGSQIAQFDFSPLTGKSGNENGWSYKWKIDDRLASTDAFTWKYTADNVSTTAYEDKVLSVEICNMIGESSTQSGENVGLSISKKYKVRVWHKAVLPNAIVFHDVENAGNDMNKTLSIRDGNNMQVQVAPLQYGYAPNGDDHYQYEWTGTQQSTKATNWTALATVTSDEGYMAYDSKSIGLTVRNVGPRGTIWEEKHVGDYDIRVYNKPKTLTSLRKKGNGSSGTMVATTNISDDELQENDYYLVFGYTTSNGETKFEAQKQINNGEARWTRQYHSDEEMATAFVYAAWINKESHVLVTSGRCYLGDKTDEKWDDSDYSYMSSANRTRAAIGTDATAIEIPQTEAEEKCDVRVYDLNGILIGTKTEGLPSGLYIIRYKVGGVEKSEKISIN